MDLTKSLTLEEKDRLLEALLQANPQMVAEAHAVSLN